MMTEPEKVRGYARVDRAYEFVRDALHRLLIEGDTAAPLSVRSICDQHDVAGLPDLTRATLGVGNEDEHAPSHLASAEIYASALAPSETQIEIEGHCVARADCCIDAAAREAAEAHIRALLGTIVERIRLQTDPSAPASGSLGSGPAAVFTLHRKVGAHV
jgi:hypothetical protein